MPVSFIRTVTVGRGISPCRQGKTLFADFTAGEDFHLASKQQYYRYSDMVTIILRLRNLRNRSLLPQHRIREARRNRGS